MVVTTAVYILFPFNTTNYDISNRFKYLLRLARWSFMFVSKDIIHDYPLLIVNIFLLSVAWAEIKRVNINEYIFYRACVYVCMRARAFVCMCFWLNAYANVIF
jgi:hypothetical protein